MVQLNLKGLAGLCHCQGIIRLLSFTICQANWLRKCCVLSLHFQSTAVWWGLNIEAAHVLTQYCIRILWNIYRVKCRHVAKGNKAIPLSPLHRFCTTYWQVWCQSAAYVCFVNFTNYFFFVIIYFCMPQDFFPPQNRRCVLGNNGLLLPASTVITMQVSGRGWVLCG